MIEGMWHFVAGVGDMWLELQLSTKEEQRSVVPDKDAAKRVVFFLHRKGSHIGYLCVWRNGDFSDAFRENEELETVGNIHLDEYDDPCRIKDAHEKPFIWQAERAAALRDPATGRH